MNALLAPQSGQYCNRTDSSHTVTVKSVADLPTIFAPDVQVICWRRPPLHAISSYLSDPGVNIGTGFLRVVDAGKLPHLPELPAAPGRDALLADIDFLGSVYADLLGCPAIGLRLEAVDRAMCPRLHKDHTGIRLLCTYRGPATEWLDDCYVNRDRLGNGSDGLPDETSGAMRPGAEIESAKPFDVVLLKGSLWQGNAARGAIHRSPAVGSHEAPRVLLAMDAIWD